MLRKIRIILKMIKFEHTIFALPFAVMSMFLASRGIPELGKISWILVAMVGARSCAMSFNRLPMQTLMLATQGRPCVQSRAVTLRNGKLGYSL
ncbi:MAG: hypothetical protein VCF25_31780 [Candidatus Poribacteria bacterium]|jgi:hypothetical protein